MKQLMSAVATVMLILVLGCDVLERMEPGSSVTEKESLSISIPIAQNSHFSDVADKATISVHNAEGVLLAEATLTISETVVSGVVEGLPVGTGYSFVLSVFDESGTLAYSGTATGDINFGTDNPISITISPLTGDATINGVISETPVGDVNLVAYFPLTSNFEDISGNEIACTPTNVTEPNGAASFDGSTGYLTCENNASLDLGEGSFSVAFWIKAPVGDGEIISKYRGAVGGPETGWNIRCEDGYGALGGPEVYGEGVRFDFSDGRNGNWWILASGMEALNNEWHHIAVIVDRTTDNATMYMDGVVVDTRDISSIGSAQNGTAVMVGYSGDSPYKLEGSLKEIRLYSDVITTAEVATLQ